MRIHPVQAEMFNADGQTGRRANMTKLTVAFRNFANAPKRWSDKQNRKKCMWRLTLMDDSL